MEPLSVVGFVLVFFVVFTSICVIREFNNPSLPGPGLFEYLPGGIVFPMLCDHRKATLVFDKLAERYGDVFSLWLGPRRIFVTSIPEDIVHLRSSAESFPRPRAIANVFHLVGPGGLFSMQGRAHQNVRRQLGNVFNHSMLKGFHGHMTEAVDELCESLTLVALDASPERSAMVDVSQFLAIATFRIITNVAFGMDMDREERLDFVNSVNIITDEMMKELLFPFRWVFSSFGVRDRLIEHRTKVRATYRKFMRRRLARTISKKEVREPDILDAVLSLEDCSEEAMISIVGELAMAGSHTTAHLIAWSIYETCCNPEVVLKIEQELSFHVRERPLNEPLSIGDLASLSYIKDVWKETCRLYTVGAVLGRRTTTDVTLRGSGINVPKGSEIHGHFRRIHRHPQLWTDPNLFKPERWSSAQRDGQNVRQGSFVPFGVGQFGCAGRFLADYEGPLIIAELHRRFKFTLACNTDEVKTATTLVDIPRYIDKVSGIEMGVPVYIQLK